MKVLHVSPAFYPATYWGGPIYSVYGLCNALAKTSGVTLRVLTTDSAGPTRSASAAVAGFPMCYPGGYKVFFCRRRFGASVSPGMLLRLWPMIRWSDVVHLTGVYSPPTITTLLICRMLGKPVVWSPRGSLQRWEGSTHLVLKAFWEWACLIVAPRQLTIHATSEQEERESLVRFPGLQTVVVPNGVEIQEKATHVYEGGTLRLLYLGRLDPKKGIDNLLMACKRLGEIPNGSWSLTIAGSGEPQYAETVRARIDELQLALRVKMVGSVAGEAKQRLFESTDIVVVPSYTENFGMVVAEALAHSVPVIASQGTPWQRLEEIGCGLWVNNDPETLAKAIGNMRTMPLQEMGQRGREWMQREFRWDIRAKEMVKCYDRVIADSL